MSKVATAKQPKVKFSVGDIVTVNNPEMFIRCGYPLGLDEAKTKVSEVIQHTDFESVRTKLELGDRFELTRELVKALALMYMESRGYGGRSRTIHTQIDTDWKGERAKITRIFYKVTGEYSPGWAGEDGEGYEPAELLNGKRHRIFDLDAINNDLVWGSPSQIEDIHVTKVEA